ncbi:hypothetical protein [Streptomyces yunnanensis]|uniref:Uncharacterized protein n=1 Tax=Streptomyces yunnanensis TaxID=156453 RepID=A0A9X8QYI1_9ACTN|nr:hypothetical protein [Streptomyces yunnanensis]SHN08850.1 hypothetical protein SAMN05216268_119105 [Streptomyces yunnanensis]
MHTNAPDPLAVLQVATDYNISEEQAATAIERAARTTVHAWHGYADTCGLAPDDGNAMEAWFRSLGPAAPQAVLDDAVIAVVGADNILAEIYRKQAGRTRVMRTNRPHLRIH